MKLQPAVVRETGRVAAGVALMLLVMLAVFLALGRLNASVLLGGLYGSAIAVVNFLLLGITVQNTVTGIQSEDTIQQNRAKSKMQTSYTLRMLGMVALAIVGIRFFGFHSLAVILPLVFPRVVIPLINLLDKRRGRNA